MERHALGVLSDCFLLGGDLQRAREVLDGKDPVREQILALLQGEVPTPEPSNAEATPVQRGLLGMLTSASASTLVGCLDPLRDTPQIGRLCLAAGILLDRLGERDASLLEALNAQAHGARCQDEALQHHAGTLVARILGSLNDARVDELVQLALQLGHETGQQAVLDRVASSTLSLVGAQRAFVLLGDQEAGLTVAASAFEPGHAGNPSLSIAREALTRGRETVTHDTGGHAVSESMEALQLRMVLCIPMADSAGVIGAISADSTTVSTRELEDIAWLVRAFAAHATVAVRHARLLHEEEVRTRRAREVVHDVKNIASGMRMGLDELRDLDLPDWAARSLEDVMAMNASLLGTVRPLLEASTPEPRDIRLDALAERAAALLRFHAQARKVEFAFKLEAVTVRGIEEDLARVLANVLGNALKYTTEGSQVRIRVARKEGTAAIAVADQGPGIPTNDLERIFDSGVQAHGAKAGFGLGLGICQRIVTDHGGRIRARNGRDKGAIFTILLPAVDTASA